jgi:hypothetical protein
VPDRSLAADVGPVGEAQRAADLLGVREAQAVEPEPWSFPLVLDAMTGRGAAAYAFRSATSWRDLPPLRPLSRFAQHATYASLIPVEASPVRGQSMAALMMKGGATAALSLYGVTGEAVAIVYAGGVTVVCTSAWPVLLRLEAAVAKLVGVEIEPPPAEPTDDPS